MQLTVAIRPEASRRIYWTMVLIDTLVSVGRRAISGTYNGCLCCLLVNHPDSVIIVNLDRHVTTTRGTQPKTIRTRETCLGVSSRLSVCAQRIPLCNQVSKVSLRGDSEMERNRAGSRI